MPQRRDEQRNAAEQCAKAEERACDQQGEDKPCRAVNSHCSFSSHGTLTAFSLTSVSTSCESSTSADVGTSFRRCSSGNQGKLSVICRAAGSKRMGLYPGLFASLYACSFSPG